MTWVLIPGPISPTVTGWESSYREVSNPQHGLKASANLTLSWNRVQHFTEYIDDYDNGGQKLNNYSSTDIALSPNTTGATIISFFPNKNFEISSIK